MNIRVVAALVVCLVLSMICAMPAYAASDVPSLVMEAREGVVRIIVPMADGFAMGTGFVVGTEDEYYVVTNHHVIDGATESIYIYYDTGKRVEAEVYDISASRDLAILEPKRSIPNVTILPLQTDDFDSGGAVYALGYPGAADMLTGDYFIYQDYNDIIADKASMTITDGIISSIKEAYMVGDTTSAVQIIQTNTAINGGNSGGPLLDKAGNVVGINTYGIVVDNTAGINGCVHVSELMSVLRSNHIDYLTAAEAQALRDNGDSGVPLWAILCIVAAALVIVVIVVIVIVAAQTKKKRAAVPAQQPAATNTTAAYTTSYSQPKVMSYGPAPVQTPRAPAPMPDYAQPAYNPAPGYTAPTTPTYTPAPDYTQPAAPAYTPAPEYTQPAQPYEPQQPYTAPGYSQPQEGYPVQNPTDGGHYYNHPQ